MTVNAIYETPLGEYSAGLLRVTVEAPTAAEALAELKHFGYEGTLPEESVEEDGLP